MSDLVFEVSGKLMVEIDGLLSCLNHRHGNKLREMGELDEVKYLATRVRKITESRSYSSLDKNGVDFKQPPKESGVPFSFFNPILTNLECNCFHMSELKKSTWICPAHGYKRL